MALAEVIGTSEVSLKCVKPGGQVFELAVTGAITISRSINSASKLTAKILRDEITVEKADTVDFVLDGEHHQFFGIVVDTNKQDEWCEITAYDQIWYLNKNKKRMTYEDITLKELVSRVCTDRGYSYSEEGLEETNYKLPSRTEDNTTELAIITNGIDATYNATTTKYFLWDDAGYLRLNSTNWLAGEPNVIVSPEYFEGYSLTETMENGYSVIRLERTLNQSTEGGDSGGANGNTNTQIETVVVRNDEANTKYGTIEYVGDASEDENVQALAESLLQQYVEDFDSHQLSINGMQGDITVRGGTPLLVDFFSSAKKEFIRGWYEVQSVTHTIENGYHTMDLELECMQSFGEWDNTDSGYYSHPALNQG